MHDSAIMIAKIMAPFLIILGIWFLVCKDFLAKLRASSDKARGILYFAALMNLLVGLIIVNFYNVWVWDMTLSVTLLGWYATIRGLYMLFMPDRFLEGKSLNKGIMKVYGFLPLIWGIILLWTIFQG